MPSFTQDAYLLGRVGAWSMNDLEDLMIEIERDGELASAERRELLERLYRVLWRRAQDELSLPAGGAEPRSAAD
jgi:hypothetical protein